MLKSKSGLFSATNQSVKELMPSTFCIINIVLLKEQSCVYWTIALKRSSKRNISEKKRWESKDH